MVCGSTLSKLIFLFENLYVSRKIHTEILVAGEGFVFAVEIYGLFSHTASTAASDTIMSSLFFTVKLVNAHKKPRQNIDEILRNKHSIFVLVTLTFSRGKNFDQGKAVHKLLGNF